MIAYNDKLCQWFSIDDGIGGERGGGGGGISKDDFP